MTLILRFPLGEIRPRLKIIIWGAYGREEDAIEAGLPWNKCDDTDD